MNPLNWPRWLQGLIGAILLALAVWFVTGPMWKVFDWFNDREAVNQDRAERRAAVTGKVLEAERSANRNDEARRRTIEQQDEALENAIDEAATEHPDETNLPAGPAVRAVLRELREQAARDSDAPA